MHIKRKRHDKYKVVPCSKTSCTKTICPNYSSKSHTNSYHYPSCLKNLTEGIKGYGI